MAAKTKKQTKLEPTAFTTEVSNPQEFEVPLPTGVDKLDPGESREIHVTKQKLGLYRSNRFINVEIVGDNSEAVAEASKQREKNVANAKDRHAPLSKTRDEARADEERITAALDSSGPVRVAS